MPSPPAPSHPESDPEGTAELPQLDPAAEAAAREQRQSQTDTWVAPLPARLAEALAPAAPPAEAPPPAGAAPARQAQLTEPALSAKLHETQDLLASRSARVTQVERARDEVHAARVAAEQRAAQLNTELGQVRAELAFQLDELARERAQFEGQLAQARALLNAASARADDLQRRFEEQESAARTQRAQELEHRQRAAQDRGRAAGFINDLHRERARALSFLESLQSAESRRLMLEGLVTDLQRQAEERERDVARVARELEGRDALARERDAELAQLRETRHETQGLQDSVAALRSQLAGATERLRTPQAGAEAHGSSDSRQQPELTRLRAELADLAAAAEAARAATLAANAQAAGHEAALEQVRSRNTELESTLIAERRRVGQLEEQLAAARRETQDWGSALKNVQQERDAHLARLGAAESRVRELEGRATEHLDSVSVLQTEANTSSARARELEGDLRAAEDAVNRLESEARARNARVEELERAIFQWRTTREEARQTATDTAANQGLQDAARAASDAEAPAAAQPAPESAARVLIRTEEGREVVHVLARRTSVGRTPDNDLQIDAKFISRHHAVILVGPVHSIIEDLNSTNGVYVNGRRITRNTLKDGDAVLFGRAEYRFVVRKSGDKR